MKSYIKSIKDTLSEMIESIYLPDKSTYGNGLYSQKNQYLSILYDVRYDLSNDFFRLLKDETLVRGWEYRDIDPNILLPLLNTHFEPLLNHFPRFKFDTRCRYPFANKDIIRIEFRRTFKQ